MGAFGLTINFNNLTNGEHPILSLYHIAHRKLGPLAAAPWIKHLLMGIPFVERMKYYRQFMNWAHEELHRNIKVNHYSYQCSPSSRSVPVDNVYLLQSNEGERTNIIGYVLENAKKNGGVDRNWNMVLGDFVLVIVAGRFVLHFNSLQL